MKPLLIIGITAADGAGAGARNKLLQILVEPIGPGPIYTDMPQNKPATEPTMQTNTILKFLADSRRYFDR
ncbi:MAG: hypothetical protein M0Z99_10110 [Betaproteobacteria bacterium]|nr:hypothetical protein [Betaproteobacteria bacterium]